MKSSSFPDAREAPRPLAPWTRPRSGGVAPPPAPSWSHVAWSWLGGVCAIAVLAYATRTLHMPLLLGSFGASCVLLFGFPESPFSQPRSVIGGHVLSSLTGLLFVAWFGVHWWSAALALGTAIALMQGTRTVHPPAGSNPVIIMLTHASWPFLIWPTLAGVVLLQAVALLYHALVPGRSYPSYWF